MTGVQTCALPICCPAAHLTRKRLQLISTVLQSKGPDRLTNRTSGANPSGKSALSSQWSKRGFPQQPQVFESIAREIGEHAGHAGIGFGPVVTSPVHDRMPVILDPDGYDLWLDPRMKNAAAASELLKPYDARLMHYYDVSSRVNHVANYDAECSEPVELAQIQTTATRACHAARPADIMSNAAVTGQSATAITSTNIRLQSQKDLHSTEGK